MLSSNDGGGMPNFFGPKGDGALGRGRGTGQAGGGAGREGPDTKVLHILLCFLTGCPVFPQFSDFPHLFLVLSLCPRL